MVATGFKDVRYVGEKYPGGKQRRKYPNLRIAREDSKDCSMEKTDGIFNRSSNTSSYCRSAQPLGSRSMRERM